MDILPYHKHLENSMTELSGSIANMFLLTYSLLGWGQAAGYQPRPQAGG